MMLKFRAAVIAFTLAAMFMIPLSAIPKDTEKQKNEKEEISSSSSSSEIGKAEFLTEEKEENFFRIFDIESEEIINVSYEDYVKGAIASEMGADFEFEALVAQGVAAFSCGLYQKNAHLAADYDFSAAPDKKLGYMTEEKARDVYGSAFDEKWAVISSAAEKAMEYVVIYDGEPALTAYHAASNGRTESAENVWGGKVPYLVSVKSPGDAFWEYYESEVTVDEKTVLEKLNKNGAGLSGAYQEQWFEGAVLTEAGYVDYIEIGGATFSGERIRSLFGLRSASFSVKYREGEFVFAVQGYGHGVGLSQIGANYMAKEGFDFKKILAHYYPGTEIVKYKNLTKNA